MQLRNISNRNITLTDTPGTIYEVPAYSQIDVNSSLWSDNIFRRTLRHRIRDIVVSDDVAVALPTVVNAANASSTPLVLAGAVSQTGDLLQLKNNAGTILSKFNAAGELTVPKVALTVVSAGTEPLTITATSGQTAALQSWRDQANNPLVQITAAGRIQLGADVELLRNAANVLETKDKLLISTATVGFGVKTDADSFDKVTIRSDTGALQFGSGSGAVDVAITRGSATRIDTNFDFRARNGVSGQTTLGLVGTGSTPGIELGTTTPGLLYRAAANNVTSAGSLHAIGQADTVQILAKGHSSQSANILEVRNSADSVLFAIGPTGNMTGGPGQTSTFPSITATDNNASALTFSGAAGGFTINGDTNLFRNGANLLRTDDSLQVGGTLVVTSSVTGSQFITAATGTGAITLSDTSGTPGITIGDVVLSRSAANKLSLATGDTLRVSDVGIEFNDNTVQATAAPSKAFIIAMGA